jgi:hypothetical protein
MLLSRTAHSSPRIRIQRRQLYRPSRPLLTSQTSPTFSHHAALPVKAKIRIATSGNRPAGYYSYRLNKPLTIEAYGSPLVCWVGTERRISRPIHSNPGNTDTDQQAHHHCAHRLTSVFDSSRVRPPYASLPYSRRRITDVLRHELRLLIHLPLSADIAQTSASSDTATRLLPIVVRIVTDHKKPIDGFPMKDLAARVRGVRLMPVPGGMS